MSMEGLWDTVKLLFHGHPDPTVVQEVPFIVSLLYYSLLVVIGRCLRAIVVHNVPTRWQQWLLDMVTTFQVLGCSLENSQVRKFYGITAYLSIMFVMAMWCALTIDNSSANPCQQLLKYLKGLQTGPDTVISILFQIAGGLLSYQYARQFWRFGLHSGHTERYAAQYCVTDLQVEPEVGFVIEFSATMMDSLIFLVTLTPFYLCEVATKMFIMCYMVILGVHLTGMYMNPINATNQSFGCHGSTALEHIVVYWVGPLLATTLSYKLYSFMVSTYDSWNSKSATVSVEVAQNGVNDQKSGSSKQNVVNGQSYDLRERYFSVMNG